MEISADSTESLLTRTKRLLEQRGDLTVRQVATGAGVGYEWLRKFLYEGFDDPSVVRIERLYRFLSDYQAAKRFERRADA